MGTPHPREGSVVLEALVNGLIIGAAYGLIALGFTMVYGILRLINFAHGDTYTIGAVVGLTVASWLQWNYWLSLIVAALACALLAMVLERIGFRPMRKFPVGAMITSIGLSIFLSNSVALTWGTEPRFFDTPYVGTSVFVGPMGFSVQRLLVFGVSVLTIILLYVFIRKTYTGKVIRAVSQDFEVASLMGINFNTVTVLVFAIAGGLAGMAGVLVSPLEVVAPYMGSSVGLKSFAVVVLGGLGNIEGTILSGFLVGLTQSLASTFISSAYSDAIVYLIMILVLLIRPTGLVGEGTENV
jgi:branched-chain amino acid transport system permease protein